MNTPDVFCRIIAGEIPAHTVYEDDRFLAFLDVNPRAPGHTLIIPKRHEQWVWDTPEYTDYMQLAQNIATAMRTAFETDMIICRIIGDEVPHAHIHLHPNESMSGDRKDFAGNAEKIRAALATHTARTSRTAPASSIQSPSAQ